LRKSRVKMKLLLKEQEFKRSWECRNISVRDIRCLGILMLESYRGTIDYEGETEEDAISEIRETINGKYGPLLEECSFVIEDEQALSACIITWSEKEKLPLLAFSMTHPDFKNQGMATFLLKKSINALLAEGYKKLYLVVTEGNLEAQHLYEKMGFHLFE
jgi:ribosomal protein S18 acetylase RimI-like enzyme